MDLPFIRRQPFQRDRPARMQAARCNADFRAKAKLAAIVTARNELR